MQARMELSEELWLASERFSDLEGPSLGHDRRPRPVESVAGRLSG